METDELQDMLETIALGRYQEYGKQGDYRFLAEQRIDAALALALIRVARGIGNLVGAVEELAPQEQPS